MTGSVNAAPLVALGYAITGNTIGLGYNVYRLLSGTGPIAQPSNLVETVNMAFDQTGKFNKPANVKNPEYFGFYDATNTQVGDYLIGNGYSFFVAGQDPLLPPQLVKCDRVFTAMRPQNANDGGSYGLGTYGGASANSGNNQALFTGFPGSCLQGTKGEKGDITLPVDVRNPWWAIRLPVIAGVTLATDDYLSDDLGRSYSISSAELTDSGYRITAKQDLT